MATQIPTTQNTDWGFYGSMEDKAKQAWTLAMTSIAQATNTDLHQVQAFLDSRHGRHFADDVRNNLHAGMKLAEAIGQATTRWMTWKISKSTQREFGIPKGLPYLTGFVIHCGILAEQ